jgi:peptide chain release factor 2
MARPDEHVGTDQGDLRSELEALRTRLTEAERYLGLGALRARCAELEEEAARPGLWDDPEHARSVTSELADVRDDVEQLEDLGRRMSDAEVLLELMVEESDDSLSDELRAVLGDLGRRLDGLELRSLLSGEHDERDAIVELHAGTGGTDAQDWCEMLLRMYLRWAERRGLSATVIVKGRFAFGLLSTERGVHRLVRMSPFDAQHRRQTSFASVDVIPFLDDAGDEVVIDDKDLRIDTYRSSGAGGQHVNKTDSAVRITHLPTGVVVSCQNERSQHQNRARAMQILAAKLLARQVAERQAALESLAGPKYEISWGNQIRSYVLAPYQLVKDLRTGVETGNVDAVLDGEIDEFIEAELRRRRAEGSPAPPG